MKRKERGHTHASFEILEIFSKRIIIGKYFLIFKALTIEFYSGKKGYLLEKISKSK
jgi:hypothetical protein